MTALHTQSELAGMLGQNIGIEKASELVASAAKELGYGDQLDVKQGLEVLERIASQPGLVGITARFAKSRVLLKWNAP